MTPRTRVRAARSALLGSSLQSKLLVMLIATSSACIAVVGGIGAVSGTDSLRDAVYDQLVSLGDARAVALENQLEGISNNIVLASKGRTVIDATVGFTAGFDELDAAATEAADTDRVDAYYREVFVPEYVAGTGDRIAPELFVPTGAAQTRLQSLYVAPFTDFSEAALQDDAGDGSTWSAVSAAYNPYFRDMAERYGYDDILLLDTRGNLVYSLYKGIDLGTNVQTGPFARGSLASAYDAALAGNDLDRVVFRDFEPYQPSYGTPTAWAVTAVGDGTRIVGALAVTFPVESTDAIMTGQGQWAAEGLGTTGETYLVGPDSLMRSVSRELLEDPDGYRADAVAAGLTADVADRIVEQGNTVLEQRVTNPSAALVLAGGSGTLVERNYLGREVLTAYAPVQIDGADWGIIASIDTAEAFAPVAALARTIALTAAALLVVVALASLLLARVLTAPVRTLAQAMRRVRAGELGVTAEVGGRDEISDLAASFNDLSTSLAVKQQLIDEQRGENDRLLASLMPPDVARRYREGQTNIADVHENVAVAYADVRGFSEYAADLAPEQEVAVLNELLRSFTDAAERMGVENVRALRGGYLASSGVGTPRVDNVRRMVDFALEMQRAVERFDRTHGAGLRLRAAIDAGQVTSGLVGRGTLAYDLWGGAVDLAHTLLDGSEGDGVFVTARVRAALGDAYRLRQAATVASAAGPVEVWQVVAER